MLDLRSDANEKLAMKVMKIGTAGRLVIQSWKFAKSMNVGLLLVTFYLGAKDLDYALGIGPQKATLSTGCAL